MILNKLKINTPLALIMFVLNIIMYASGVNAGIGASGYNIGGGKITVEEDNGGSYENITKIIYTGNVTQTVEGTVEMSGTTSGSSEFITDNNVRIYHDGTDWVSEDDVNLGSNDLTTTGTITGNVTGNLTGVADEALSLINADDNESIEWDNTAKEWDVSDDVNVVGTVTATSFVSTGGGGTAYVSIGDNDGVIVQKTNQFVFGSDTTKTNVSNTWAFMEIADFGHANRAYVDLSGTSPESPLITLFPASTTTTDQMGLFWKDNVSGDAFGMACIRAYGGSVGLWSSTAQVVFMDGSPTIRGYWTINSTRKQWEFIGIDNVTDTFIFSNNNRLYTDFAIEFNDPAVIVHNGTSNLTEYIAINYNDGKDRPCIYSGKGTPIEIVDNDTEFWTNSEAIIVAENDTGAINVIAKQIDSQQMTIQAPESFTSEIIMFRVDASEFPNGIVLTSVTLTKNDNTSTADIDIEKWDDMAGTGAMVITSFNNFDEYERTVTALTENTIDAGDIIMVDATAMTDNIDLLHVKFNFVAPAD